MKIINKKIEELEMYDNNPRKNDEAVPYVMESIQKYGFRVPLVIDKNNVIVTGHTRYKASLKLGLKEVPCIVASDLNEKQIREFRIVDNKTSEYAEWDIEKLNLELEDLDLDLDLDSSVENIYTDKVDTPIYEPKVDKMEKVFDLYNDEKFNELKHYIEISAIDDVLKDFFIKCATRFLVFDYSKIANFYCLQNEEVQDIMEKLALIIIDYDKAIENGFVKLGKQIDDSE